MPRWPQRTLAVRFWAKVDQSAGPSGCWPWCGALNAYGRGVFRLDGGRIVYAHRLALALSGRPLADDELACHSCPTKSCCNPAHLYGGDHSDNLRDAWRKGERRRWLKHALRLEL